MQDLFGRKINYLRLSVTEACNFRCSYCAPNGHRRPTAPPLTLKEIEQVARAAVAIGIVNIRVTGGEPLMRRDIVEMVQMLVDLEGVRDVSLTTNGYLLAELAVPLQRAGLGRINVSLDTLRPDRFARVVGRDAFSKVWHGIESAEQAGLAPLKINVVMLRGVNDDEVLDFARLTQERPWHVRFIELMPIASPEYFDPEGENTSKPSCRRMPIDGSEEARDFFARHFVSANELMARLEGLEPIEAPRGSGPARTYRLPNARGTLGFITPASQHFCSSCNRIRVTSEGVALPCLFSEQGANIRAKLRDHEQAKQALEMTIKAKPETHPIGSDFAVVAGAMGRIGG
jgi:GTP 3',8-cyclase